MAQGTRLAPIARRVGCVKTRINFGESAGLEDIDAEEEEARLEGDEEVEEGDADIDEDAELDAPMVIEIPDESTGSNSVEFVEVDPPSKRRKRGRSVYPTTIGDEDITEEERSVHPVSDPDGRAQKESTYEEAQERRTEQQAADDVEAEDAGSRKKPPVTQGRKMKSRRAIEASIAKGQKTKTKKAPVKGAVARKATATRKPVAKKPAAKKPVATKKTARTKAATKKSPVKKTSPKAIKKKAVVKKASTKPAAKKAVPRKKKK